MNLKESFRYQNYLDSLFHVMETYVRDQRNITQITQKHRRTSANPGASDETMDATPERPYALSNNQIADFILAILDEKYRLSLAIGKAKSGCGTDIDAESSINRLRHIVSSVFSNAGAIRPSERKTQSSDYKLNATGEQVRYLYEVQETVTIDFNRDKYKGIAKAVAQQADEASAKIDRCMIDVEVVFVPRFNVSDSVEDAMESYVQEIQHTK